MMANNASMVLSWILGVSRRIYNIEREIGCGTEIKTILEYAIKVRIRGFDIKYGSMCDARVQTNARVGDAVDAEKTISAKIFTLFTVVLLSAAKTYIVGGRSASVRSAKVEGPLVELLGHTQNDVVPSQFQDKRGRRWVT